MSSRPPEQKPTSGELQQRLADIGGWPSGRRSSRSWASSTVGDLQDADDSAAAQGACELTTQAEPPRPQVPNMAAAS